MGDGERIVDRLHQAHQLCPCKMSVSLACINLVTNIPLNNG